MADGRYFDVKITTPDRLFFEGEADMIEFVTTEGEIGVYKNHEPTTVVITPGVLKIHKDGKLQKAAIHGGFAEILQERVDMLLEIAEWPDEIDVNRAQEALVRAERRLKSGDKSMDLLRSETALRKSLVRLEAADKK